MENDQNIKKNQERTINHKSLGEKLRKRNNHERKNSIITMEEAVKELYIKINAKNVFIWKNIQSEVRGGLLGN